MKQQPLLLLFAFLFLLSNSLFSTIEALFEVQSDNQLSALKYSEAKWELIMLNKLKFSFDQTDYYYGAANIGGKFYVEPNNGKHTKNVDIEFGSENGTLFCKYQVPIHMYTLGMLKWQNPGEGEKQWKFVLNDEESFQELQTFMIDEHKKNCQLEPNCNEENIMWANDNDYEMLEGGGKFNQEMDDPECLYSFYKIATDRNEYDMLRYCAKGYFYRGFDYDDPRAKLFREDWVLYLVEGTLKCNASGGENPQGDYDLMSMNWQLDMQQIIGDKPHWLSQFSDDDRDGKFMLAGIFGSVKLAAGASSIQDSYEYKLEIGHYCTKAKEYNKLTFDLKFDRKLIAEPERRVQEDKGLVFMLNQGSLTFPTGHVVCAKEFQQGCIPGNQAKQNAEEKIARLLNSAEEESEENGTNSFNSIGLFNGTTTNGTNEERIRQMLIDGQWRNGNSSSLTAEEIEFVRNWTTTNNGNLSNSNNLDEVQKLLMKEELANSTAFNLNNNSMSGHQL